MDENPPLLTEAQKVSDELTAISELRRLPWVRAGSADVPVGSAKPIPHTPGQKTVAEIVIEDRG
jgi:hypothetical protein